MDRVALEVMEVSIHYLVRRIAVSHLFSMSVGEQSTVHEYTVSNPVEAFVIPIWNPVQANSFRYTITLEFELPIQQRRVTSEHSLVAVLVVSFKENKT